MTSAYVSALQVTQASLAFDINRRQFIIESFEIVETFGHNNTNYSCNENIQIKFQIETNNVYAYLNKHGSLSQHPYQAYFKCHRTKQ